MAYYSDKATEDELKALEKDIAEVYKQASKDVADTSAKYFANFEDRYVHEYAAYLKGEGGYSDPTTSKQKFNAWYLAQVGRGEKWDKLQEQLAKRMTDANKVAAAYINDKTPGIYSLNANYEAYQIYNSTGVDFNLVDEQTVKGLMTGNTKILPESRVNASVDEKWNEKQLSKALLGGILQGKGIGDIATAFQNVTNMDRTSAIRNARTSMTGAQNAGRQATYEAAKEMGIDIKKEWIATEDDRTRESHAELDGVQVGYDEEFPNGLMYPGDPKGDPEEVYNCRCTIRAIIPKYNGQQRTSEIEGHEGDHTKETYNEWLKRKEEEKAERQQNQKPWTSAQASAEAMEAKEDKTESSQNAQNTKDRAKSLDNFDDYSDNVSKKREAEIGEKKAEELKGWLNNLVEESDYCMRVHSDELDEILDSHFKNQFETLDSSATYNPIIRENASGKLFGCDTNNLKAEDFEKYGYLGAKDKATDFTNGDLNGYGDVIVTFRKDDIGNNVTYTLGDSLRIVDSNNGIAGKIEDGEINLSGIPRGSVEDIYETLKYNDDVKDPSGIASFAGKEYIELQYHGRLTPDMVDSITVSEKTKDTINSNTIKKLHDKGIKIYYVDSNGDNREIK